jgi:hypothetical protein
VSTEIGVSVGVGYDTSVGVSVAAFVSVGVLVAIGVSVGVAINVGVFVGVSTLISVAVDVGVLCGLGLRVAVPLERAVAEAVLVGVAVNVNVEAISELVTEVDITFPDSVAVFAGGTVPSSTNDAAIQASFCSPVALTKYQLPSGEMPITNTLLPRSRVPNCCEVTSGSARKRAVATLIVPTSLTGVTGIEVGSGVNALLLFALLQPMGTLITIIKNKKRNNLPKRLLSFIADLLTGLPGR